MDVPVSIAIHGIWIPAIPAGMTLLSLSWRLWPDIHVSYLAVQFGSKAVGRQVDYLAAVRDGLPDQPLRLRTIRLVVVLQHPLA